MQRGLPTENNQTRWLLPKYVADTQTILAMVLSITAGLMIWYILRFRQNRRMNNLEDLEEYSGMAKNPENLMNPDDEALDELDRLLSKEFDSDE